MSPSLFSQFQPLAAIATTPIAVTTLSPLCCSSRVTLWVPQSLQNLDQTQVYSLPLKEQIASLWQQNRALIFCLATGAVVRLIAPLLKDKTQDPAVLVIDPQGHFVISLCGSHQGGGDKLAQLIAQQIGATPVLTGASASLKLPGIDILGLPFGWRRGSGNWTGVSAAIAREDRVEVIQEAGSTLWQNHLRQGHPFTFRFPHHASDKPISASAQIWISPNKREFPSDTPIPQVQWHPRVLWVGIGCERGTSQRLIATAIEQVCERYHLAQEAIAGIATIDLKADEEGILAFCRDRQFPLKTFTSDLLNKVEVPNPSPVVKQAVGTSSVAEAAALLASQDSSPIPNSHLLVPKQVYKLKGEPGAVTVAIAQAEPEYTGRRGQLLLVGMGPGDLTQMTPAAKTALTQADAVIGYSLYLKLIEPLMRPGQIIEGLPITQEQQRAQRAIELAYWGLTVAVVSSGDCGIYGMAGLVLEQLQEIGWDGKVPGVEVFPGITALQAAAAKVGAPLMQDFCGISLSDLLIPWQVIVKRLEAAAVGDFVTALYNPRSLKRTRQIVRAREIFLKYRHPNTPVALVRSAYRPEEEITLTTLERMLDSAIDMFTTVIIGNSSTRNYANWLITPRKGD